MKHYRVGMEAGFQVIKFGGILICRLILRTLGAGLQ